MGGGVSSLGSRYNTQADTDKRGREKKRRGSFNYEPSVLDMGETAVGRGRRGFTEPSRFFTSILQMYSSWVTLPRKPYFSVPKRRGGNSNNSFFALELAATDESSWVQIVSVICRHRLDRRGLTRRRGEEEGRTKMKMFRPSSANFTSMHIRCAAAKVETSPSRKKRRDWHLKAPRIHARVLS